MSTLNALLSACQTEQEPLLAATRERVAQWDNLLQPLSGSSPAGEEPGYDDDFQQMREISPGNDDILALEPEAVALADSEGPDAALGWLQARPGITTVRQQWLLRLLMARIAEQYGKNDLAVRLFAHLGERAGELTLTNWEPELLFEVQARHLKLLRLKAGRSEADKARLTLVMDQLLAGLIAVDPTRAAVLCG